ncbi:MAG: Polysaccharide biosynthesis protein [Bacteroidetes bacterium]|nr:Polysaccharide biosynthesis protein [Bacteroidota bacterium]
MTKIVTVIQARSGSTRLPGKVMMDILGRPLLIRMVERVQRAKLAGTIVIATTTEGSDDVIEELCKKENLPCYRGDHEDLLDRHYQAGKLYGADAVVKIPSDCPLIDPTVIDKVLQYYLDNNFDFVSNMHPASYPDGNDVEIMSIAAMEKAWQNAMLKMEREHTTPYIWEHPELFTIGNVLWETGLDYSMSHRLTIDYPEDFAFIERVYEELYPGNPAFGLSDILHLTREKPEIYEINSKYAGVNWYRNHLDELKTITSDKTKKI